MADFTEFIDWLDTNFDTIEVSGGTQLKVNGQCPFCGEDRQDMRMYVNVRTGLGVCFHCGTNFGPYKFIMAHEDCSLDQAKAIAEGDPNGWARTPSQPPVDPDLVWPLAKSIEDSPAASAYLADRGIPSSLINHFGLYYCETPTQIEDRIFHTQKRIIIPIHDIHGKPVSWQGRTIGNAKPKYLFPPAFKGAETLFNAWSIPKHADYLIICEGVMDIFGWWRHSAKNAIATFGKKISQKQIDIITDLNPKTVFIAWDTDAMWLNYTFAENYGHLFDIRIIDLMGKDADECTVNELTVALKNSKGYSWEDKIGYALKL
jgi:DNA primase